MSEQDLESVGGASGREGLQRTAPRREKFERPRKEVAVSFVAEMVGGALVHGVASSWAAMTSSMLASPQGASEQYMWMETLSWMVNGWEPWMRSSGGSGRIQSEVGHGGVEM